MKLWVVIKAPVGLEGTAEIVGAFTTHARAEEACRGAGTYTVAEVDADRAYRAGEMLDVRLVRRLDHREIDLS